MFEKIVYPWYLLAKSREFKTGTTLCQIRHTINKWCAISEPVEFGNTVGNAVIREIKEETNVNARIIRFTGIYSSPGSQTYSYTHQIVQYGTLYVEVKLTGTISLNYSNKETQELTFFSQDEIPSDFSLINPNWLPDAVDKNEKILFENPLKANFLKTKNLIQ
jgi:ADP-ribose pyrophosphatase YjhB (NUDIX family)